MYSGLWTKNGEQILPSFISINAKVVDLAAQVVFTKTYSDINKYFATMNKMNKSNEEDATFKAFLNSSMGVLCGFEINLDGKKITSQVVSQFDAMRLFEKTQISTDDIVKEASEGMMLSNNANNTMSIEEDFFLCKVNNLSQYKELEIIITYSTEMSTQGDYLLMEFPTSLTTIRSSQFFETLDNNSSGSNNNIDGSSTNNNSNSSNSNNNSNNNNIVNNNNNITSNGGSGLSRSTSSNKLSLSSSSIQVNQKQGLLIEMNLEMPSNISEIISPSHPKAIDVEYKGENGKVTYKDSRSIDVVNQSDLVVLIKLDNPHEPYGFIEENENGSRALMIAFYPQLSAASLNATATPAPGFENELIFLVDVSESMEGYNMKHAKKALHRFLHSLSKDTYFNIISFASTHRKLFQQSVKYNDENLKAATAYVESLKAISHGETNLLEPLKDIYSAASTTRPRKIFLLTDGRVNNIGPIVDLVRQNAHNTSVFPIGMGEYVSRQLVEYIANAGSGVAELVIENDTIESKVMRQLKRALQPAMSNIRVDWGSLSSKSQAPRDLRTLFFGDRLTIYNILGKDEKIDGTTVKLIANGPSGPVSFPVTIKSEETKKGSLVHSLAAYTLIQDLQDQISENNLTESKEIEPIRQKIIDLGIKYGLASNYTYFCSVEQPDENEQPAEQQPTEQQSIIPPVVEEKPIENNNGLEQPIQTNNNINLHNLTINSSDLKSNDNGLFKSNDRLKVHQSESHMISLRGSASGIPTTLSGSGIPFYNQHHQQQSPKSPQQQQQQLQPNNTSTPLKTPLKTPLTPLAKSGLKVSSPEFVPKGIPLSAKATPFYPSPMKPATTTTTPTTTFVTPTKPAVTEPTTTTTPAVAVESKPSATVVEPTVVAVTTTTAAVVPTQVAAVVEPPKPVVAEEVKTAPVKTPTLFDLIAKAQAEAEIKAAADLKAAAELKAAQAKAAPVVETPQKSAVETPSKKQNKQSAKNNNQTTENKTKPAAASVEAKVETPAVPVVETSTPTKPTFAQAAAAAAAAAQQTTITPTKPQQQPTAKQQPSKSATAEKSKPVAPVVVVEQSKPAAPVVVVEQSKPTIVEQTKPAVVEQPKPVVPVVVVEQTKPAVVAEQTKPVEPVVIEKPALVEQSKPVEKPIIKPTNSIASTIASFSFQTNDAPAVTKSTATTAAPAESSPIAVPAVASTPIKKPAVTNILPTPSTSSGRHVYNNDFLLSFKDSNTKAPDSLKTTPIFSNGPQGISPSSGGSGGKSHFGKKRGGNDRGGNRRGGNVDPDAAPVVVKKIFSQDVQGTHQELLKKFKFNLNRITMDTYSSLIKNFEELKVPDDEALKSISKILFEKAIIDQKYSAVYAILANHLDITFPKFGDISIKRAILANCETEFETVIDRTKFEGLTKEDTDEQEFIFKRRVLGNIKFIGELYKHGVLGEKVVKAIVSTLITKCQERLDEESIEPLVKILTTIGKKLDEVDKVHTDTYFAKVQTISEQPSVTSRGRFILLDLLDLRSNKWQPKNQNITKSKKEESEKEERFIAKHGSTTRDNRDDRRGGRDSRDNRDDRRGGGRDDRDRRDGRDSRDDRRGGGRDDRDRRDNRDDRDRRSSNSAFGSTKSKDGWETVGKPGSGKGGRGGNNNNNKQSPSGGKGGKDSGFGSSSNSLFGRRGDSRDNNNSSPYRPGQGFGRKEETVVAPPNRGSNLFSALEDDDYQPSTSPSNTPSTFGGRGNDRNNNNKSMNDRDSRDSRDNHRGNDRNNNKQQQNNKPTVVPVVVAEPIKPEEPKIDFEKIEDSIQMTLDEYVETHDIDEAIECIKEINEPTVLAKQFNIFISKSLERREKDKQLIIELFGGFLTAQLFNAEQIKEGLKEIIDNIEDIEVDLPFSGVFVATIVGVCIESEIFPLNYLEEAYAHLVDSGKAEEMIVNTFDSIVKVSDKDRLVEIYENTQGLDILKLFALKNRKVAYLEEFYQTHFPYLSHEKAVEGSNVSALTEQPDLVEHLLHLQSADGYWQLDKKLAGILGVQLNVVAEAESSDSVITTHPDVWATCLAINFVKLNSVAELDDNEDDLELVLSKSFQWLSSQYSSSKPPKQSQDEVLLKAKRLLSEVL